MNRPATGEREAEIGGFLRGVPSVVAEVSEAVRASVRGFRLAETALERELEQEALTRTFLSLSSGRFRGKSSLRSYASRVARYTCLEHLRRRRREVGLDADCLPSEERWSQPEESFLWTEAHLRNLETFSRLPGDARELLRLVFVERLSYREVGMRLGISPGAVKTRVYRCRAALQRSRGRSRAVPPGLVKGKVVPCE